MKNKINKIAWASLLTCGMMLVGCNTPEKEAGSLKDAYKGHFLIGAAVNVDQSEGRDTAGGRGVKEHFNSITAENCMKSMYLQPAEGDFFFDEADKFIEFGEANGMHIVGHTLVWHSQAPDWFFTDDEGNDVTRDVLIERMRNHIRTVVERYKGRVHGWDVVNEAILDDG